MGAVVQHPTVADIAQQYVEARSNYELAVYQLQTARILLNALIYRRRMNGERAKDIARELHLTPLFVSQAFVSEKRRVAVERKDAE